MKAFQAFSILGGIVVIIGVYVLIPTFPLTAHHNLTMGVGANMYLYDKFNVFKSGHLSGQFSESQGQALGVYVFTDAEYTTFTNGYLPQGLFSSDGPASGSFSVSIPAPGNYYLIFMHGTGLENTSQTVDFSVTLDGYNPVILAAGFGLLAAGAVLVIVGFYLRNKYLDKLLTPATSDMVVFDKPSPPTSQG